MTIHFVYAVPKAPGLVNRLRSASARFLGDRLDIPKFGSDRSNPDLSWWPQPCYSLFSITADLLPELRPPMSFSGVALETLAQECDVFLTMGVSDANLTTILEAMAWGFPVACTPQSGYHNVPVIRSLSTTEMEYNLSILDAFQNAPEEELMAHADEARRLVEQKYTFERFTNTVLGPLRELGVG